MVTSDEYEQVNIVAMVRPPGHHAEKDKADGFCYKNNVASLVKRTREKHPNAKILVIDLDVHHGNGTISIFNDEQYDNLRMIDVYMLGIYPFDDYDEPDNKIGGNFIAAPLKGKENGDAYRKRHCQV
ncbi:MAG: hypothetical protein GY782_00250 [Gammaproteobacteria bacterium]|nr:hypothetical protein [Gammaproteobacteria bacterium]